MLFFFFFFNDTATTEIYTLSLHDALPISHRLVRHLRHHHRAGGGRARPGGRGRGDRARRRGHARARSLGRAHSRLSKVDRKSTRLNSSHDQISYAVFCLKKKKLTEENSHS